MTRQPTPEDWEKLSLLERRTVDELKRVWQKALDGDPTALAVVSRWPSRRWQVKRRGGDRLADRYADALAKLERVEADLARVLNRWQSARARVRRLSKQLDKAGAAELEAN